MCDYDDYLGGPLQVNGKRLDIVETTTDSNGWTKIVFPTHVEYVKTIYDTNITFGGDLWGHLTSQNLPTGLNTLGDRIFTCAVGCNDAAILLNAYCYSSFSTIDITWTNKYNQQVIADVYAQFRILEYV